MFKVFRGCDAGSSVGYRRDSDTERWQLRRVEAVSKAGVVTPSGVRTSVQIQEGSVGLHGVFNHAPARRRKDVSF